MFRSLLSFVILWLLCEESISMTMKKILVSGGNKGIGKAICERLVTNWKDTYVLLGARDPEKGQQAINDIIKSVGEGCKDRLELVVLDTSSDASVQAAAQNMDGELYGIINNAGIGFNRPMKEVINTNYFGLRRVNAAFGKFLKRPGGRIVNVSSASGPNYVSNLPSSSALKAQLAQPWTIPGGVKAVDELAHQANPNEEGYGLSKSLVNAYTCILAKLEPDLIINAVTPGYISTDLTAGMGATNPPSKGAVPPCWLCMDDDVVPNLPTGRYYGSDCVRSPIAFYRGPGEPLYKNDEDLVPLPETAVAASKE